MQINLYMFAYSVNINTSKASTDGNTKMTKSQLRSEIKNAIKAGLTIDEAGDAVQYEFEMYAPPYRFTSESNVFKMSIESIMAAVKRRRALLSEASNSLWLSDYELMTAEERENMHMLKLNIKNECLAAKNRLARRVLNNQRGRTCST